MRWLDRAFNWSPKFDYVVKTLEGKGDKAVKEREERLRKITIGLQNKPWRVALKVLMLESAWVSRSCMF